MKFDTYASTHSNESAGNHQSRTRSSSYTQQFDPTAYLSLTSEHSEGRELSPFLDPIIDSADNMNVKNPSPVYRRVTDFKTGFDNFISFSEKRGTLYFCVFLFTIYFAVGAAVYSLLFEKWTIIDSLYFTVVTFTTCGFGDLVPETENEMIFTGIFVLFGVLVFATVAFGIVFERVFEKYENAIRQAQNKTSRHFLRRFHSSSGESHEEERLTSKLCSTFCEVLPLIVMVIGGAMGIGYIEDWEIVRSIYFAIVVGSSVGYGDVFPNKESTRLACVFYVPFAVGVTAEIFGKITSCYLSHKREQNEKEFLNRRLTMADIERMDRDKNGEVSKEEFLRFFLVTMGKCTHEDLDKLEDLFQKLDSCRDGKLSCNDLVEMTSDGDEELRASLLQGLGLQ